MIGCVDEITARELEILYAETVAVSRMLHRLRIRLHVEAGRARGLSGADLYAANDGTEDSRALMVACEYLEKAARIIGATGDVPGAAK